MKRVVGIARSGAGRVGLVAAVIMAGVAALSAPASAHSAILSGSTVCSDGSHIVNWSIGNDWNTPMTIVSAVSTMNGQSYPVVGYTSPVYVNAPTAGISTLPGSTGTATLTVHGTWQDGANHFMSTSVVLEHNCNGGGTTTTASSTTQPPSTTASTTSAPSTTMAPSTTLAPTTTTEAATTTTEAATTTTSGATTTTAPGGTTTTGGGGTTTTAASTTTSTTLFVGGSTTISIPEETTTTAAPTTTEAPTTTAAPTTTEDTTPNSGQGTTIVSTSTTEDTTPNSQQAVPTTLAGGESLPRTGSNPTLPVVFGAGCLAVGAALAMRKRRNWTRP